MSTFREGYVEVLREIAILGKRAALSLHYLENPTLLSNSSVDDINIEEIRKLSDQIDDEDMDELFKNNVEKCNKEINYAARNGHHKCEYAFTWLKNKKGISTSSNMAYKGKLIGKMIDYYQQKGFEVNVKEGNGIEVKW